MNKEKIAVIGGGVGAISAVFRWAQNFLDLLGFLNMEPFEPLPLALRLFFIFSFSLAISRVFSKIYQNIRKVLLYYENTFVPFLAFLITF